MEHSGNRVMFGYTGGGREGGRENCQMVLRRQERER